MWRKKKRVPWKIRESFALILLCNPLIDEHLWVVVFFFIGMFVFRMSLGVKWALFLPQHLLSVKWHCDACWACLYLTRMTVSINSHLVFRGISVHWKACYLVGFKGLPHFFWPDWIAVVQMPSWLVCSLPYPWSLYFTVPSHWTQFAVLILVSGRISSRGNSTRLTSTLELHSFILHLFVLRQGLTV